MRKGRIVSDRDSSKIPLPPDPHQLHQLRYRDAGAPPPEREQRIEARTIRWFLAGLAMGGFLSGILYRLAGRGLMNETDLWLHVGGMFEIVKLIAGFACITHKHSAIGAGLLASIPVGLLIFFGLCAQYPIV
jgi:hypothetical protein